MIALTIIHSHDLSVNARFEKEWGDEELCKHVQSLVEVGFVDVKEKGGLKQSANILLETLFFVRWRVGGGWEEGHMADWDLYMNTYTVP